MNILNRKVEFQVKRIKTLVSRDLAKSAKTGGCGECQTSCQSASKTSCSVANQQCEQCKN
nr:six-cysteine ranthipeptide SCIFF [Anaerovorax odorimutans]